MNKTDSQHYYAFPLFASYDTCIFILLVIVIVILVFYTFPVYFFWRGPQNDMLWVNFQKALSVSSVITISGLILVIYFQRMDLSSNVF